MLMTIEADKESGRARSQRLDTLLERVGQGDRDAFASLYEETRADVYGFALSLTRSKHEAEDVSHDVFLRVWSSAPRYVSSGKPMAWILTITKNLSMSKLREQGRRLEAPAEEALADIAGDPGLSPEDRHLLSQALGELSEDELKIVTLHAVSGFAHGEIAQMLELPGATVRTKYRRALMKLKKIVEEGNA